MLIPWKKHGLEYSESSFVNDFQQMMSVSFWWVTVFQQTQLGRKTFPHYDDFTDLKEVGWSILKTLWVLTSIIKKLKFTHTAGRP